MNRRRRRPLLLPALLLAPGWLLAAASPAPSPSPAGSPGSFAPLALYFVGLILVAGAGIYLVRNGWPKFGSLPTASRKLHLREMRSLGGRQFLVVVEYENQKMLLGVTPGKIDYLSPLEADGPPADFAPLVPSTPPEAAS